MKKTQFTTMLTLASLILSIMIPAKTIVRAETIETEIKTETPKVKTDYGKVPMLFEQNKGQTDKTAKFISRGKGYTLYLTDKEAVFSLKVASEQSQFANEISKSNSQRPKTKSDNLRMSFANANANPKIEGAEEAITKTNYYIGKSKFENLSNYQKVNYSNVYNGIDAVFYGNQQNQLEYDFNVSPNADANQIKLNFDGAEDVSISEKGDLVIKTENTELVQQKPIAYQIIDGERKEVSVSYKLIENQVSFELGEYDKSQTLTIDPVLNYLTYIGGTGFDDVFEVAADNEGNAYFSGTTESLNFHGEARNSNNKSAAYVAKINPQGTAFLYLTILEGNGDDFGNGITVDPNNNVFVTGIASHFFPTTSGAYDTVHGVLFSDAFVAKLNSTGGLVYSTFLGGNTDERGFDIAVDSSGKAYVVGDTTSTAFPNKNKYQGCGFWSPVQSFNSPDAFLTVLNASGSDITYSTCIGGSFDNGDTAFSVVLDTSNNAYITGFTSANNFPTKNAFQPNSGSGDDGFVAKFNPSASGEASLIYSTYIGGAGTDQGNGIAVNSNGQAVVVGLTGSTNFPLVNAFDTTNQINEGFVSVISANGTSLVNSSFLGGSDQDQAFNVALGNGGLIYVTGNTLSNNFPLALPFQTTRAGVRDAFVTKLRFGSGVLSSSYLGGNGNESGDGIVVKGNFIYVAGQTASNNLATTSGVISTAFGGGTDDGFVAKILDTAVDSVGVFRPSSTFQITQSTTNIVSQTLTFTSLLAGAKGVSGDFDGDGITTTGSFSNGIWKIRNTNFPFINPFSVITTNFGVGGDLPVVGDWNGDGIDTIGVYRPSAQQFFLSNSIVNPLVDFTINFGIAEDLPIAGDWNGDGIDTIAVYRPSVGQTFFTNQNILNPSVDITANLGVAEDLPTAGDWNGDGKDSLGLWRPSINTFFLSDDNATLRPPVVFGQFGDQPLAGDWDGKP